MMRRGDLVLVDFDPVRGNEVSKLRPAVVVSNDGANRRAVQLGRGVLTVVPVTSNVERVFPFQVLLEDVPGLRVTSKAQAEQVRSVSLERMGRVLGRVTTTQLKELDNALRLHLSL
ncbi:type II toxin-antitoxin system PemK/MazF family toxin [Nocardia amikacinitolerans]|uniref:type II toxin-antitoxin system PemK/MazF family toxin n=1 Tax=Nocardia amikacinitolerans TaxID=756689 RepID=UPI00157BBB52|nr:type II toxin-antitoxin system PemK/MazF family toxin [Nocardia amikacinitolerans]